MSDSIIRTPVRQKAKQFVKSLRQEHPDYNYLRELFRHLRRELEIKVVRKAKKLPYGPPQDAIKQ